MARMDLPKVEYWHINLSGNRFSSVVNDALSVFPNPQVTYSGGIFTKKMRAYHSGGAVSTKGKRVGESCLECEFPGMGNIKGLESYIPISLLGFGVDAKFANERDAERLVRILKTWEHSAGYSLENLNFTESITNIHTGKRYTCTEPYRFDVTGLWFAPDLPRTIELHTQLKNAYPNEISRLKFSSHTGGFDLKTAKPF